MVFDITNRISFLRCATWLEELHHHNPKIQSIVLVGNKRDLESQRKVSYEEAQQWATSQGLMYTETSAKDEYGNVAETFYQLVQHMYERIQSGNLQLNDTSGVSKGISILLVDKSHQTKCCQ